MYRHLAQRYPRFHLDSRAFATRGERDQLVERNYLLFFSIFYILFFYKGTRTSALTLRSSRPEAGLTRGLLRVAARAAAMENVVARPASYCGATGSRGERTATLRFAASPRRRGCTHIRRTLYESHAYVARSHAPWAIESTFSIPDAGRSSFRPSRAEDHRRTLRRKCCRVAMSRRAVPFSSRDQPA